MTLDLDTGLSNLVDWTDVLEQGLLVVCLWDCRDDLDPGLVCPCEVLEPTDSLDSGLQIMSSLGCTDSLELGLLVVPSVLDNTPSHLVSGFCSDDEDVGREWGLVCLCEL